MKIGRKPDTAMGALAYRAPCVASFVTLGAVSARALHLNIVPNGKMKIDILCRFFRLCGHGLIELPRAPRHS